MKELYIIIQGTEFICYSQSLDEITIPKSHTSELEWSAL